MEIITRFLEAMQALLLLKVAMLLALGGILVSLGVAKRKKWLIAGGLVVAFGQFAWPLIANKSYESAVAERRAYVANLPKVRLPVDYPRRLVLEGEISNSNPGWFIAAGYVDEVDFGGQRLVALEGVAAEGIDRCRQAALALANPDPTATDQRFGENPFQYIKKCTRVAGPASSNSDAIILRIDGRTRLFNRENARRNGAPRAIQISLRRNGKEMLVHYDEIPILSYRSSATQLLPGGYDYPCSQFAYIQIAANILDAARRPSASSKLLARGATRHSKYDPCIASMPPVSDEEARD